MKLLVIFYNIDDDLSAGCVKYSDNNKGNCKESKNGNYNCTSGTELNVDVEVINWGYGGCEISDKEGGYGNFSNVNPLQINWQKAFFGESGVNYYKCENSEDYTWSQTENSNCANKDDCYYKCVKKND